MEQSSQKSEIDELELLEERGANMIFRFSSPGDKSKKSKLKGNPRSRKKKGVEVQKLEWRFFVCLKRRKTGKSVSVDSCACSYNGNTNSLFGCGVGAGIMYMMLTGKPEVSKLNATVDQTMKDVVKNELCKRKASCNSISSCPSDRNTNESSEYPSCVLTQTPEPQHAVQDMDQLEADLEYELSKLTSCVTEVSFNEGIGSELYQTAVLATGAQQMCSSYQFNGVEPSVLDKKLSQLLIQQQESQINDLEYELQSANSKLHQKEAELRALKDCVRRLSNFSMSNTSGNETETETTAEEMVADL